MGALVNMPGTGVTTRSTSTGVRGQLDMVFSDIECQDLAAVRAMVRAHARWWRVAEGTTERLVTAVNELLTNVLVHTKPSDNGKRPVSLLLQRVSDGVTAVVRDQDRRAPIRVAPQPCDESGRGWVLLQQLVDEHAVSLTSSGKDIWFYIAASNTDVSHGAIAACADFEHDEVQVDVDTEQLPPQTYGRRSEGHDAE